MPRRWRHYGDNTGSPELSGGDGKSREEEMRRTATAQALKVRPGSKQKPRRDLAHASAEPNAATSAPGSQKKVADGVA